MYRISLVIGVGLFLAGCQTPPRAQWSVKDITISDSSAWTAPEFVGERTVRTVRAGQNAVWAVAPWWGSASRPERGHRCVLEIQYRDTLETPAVFSSWAGLEGNGQHTEIHRFGGSADGQWKVAVLPLSWDLLYRNSEGLAEFSIRSEGADLPISDIALRPVTEGDKETYFAEIREWVSQANRKRFPDFRLPEVEKPNLPEALADAPLVGFHRPYTMGLLRHEVPTEQQAASTVQVRMTLDEYEPALLGVYANGMDAENVTVRVTKLQGPAGATAPKIWCFTAEYLPTQRGQGSAKTEPKEVMLRLWPMVAVDIPAGRSHGFWLLLESDPETTTPGRYHASIQIRSKTASAEMPLEVEVLDLTLLTARDMEVPMGGCVSSLPPEQEMITYGRYNQCSIHLFGTRYLELENQDGTLDIGFDIIDDWMDVATENGVTDLMWFFGNPNGYPDTLHLERRLFRSRAENREERLRLRREFIDRHRTFDENPEQAGPLPEVVPLYKQFVHTLGERGAERGWPRLMLHPFDEPAKWDRRAGAGGPMNVMGMGPWLRYHFSRAADVIREGSDKVLVAGDLHHAEPGLVFLDDVDVFCTNAIHEDLELGEKVRQAGKIFWQYRGCNATMTPFSPRHSYGFYFGAFNSTGGLIWATNWGPGFDYNERSASWMYSWYTPFGTIISPAYEGLREGLDDRRLIETCRKRLEGDPEAMALLESMFAQTVADRIQNGKDIVGELESDPAQHERLVRWRNTLLDALMQAGQ